jgi:hypothetical protein
MWLRILVLSVVFLMGLTSCKGNPDLAFLVTFLTDDDALMQELWDLAGELGPGVDVTAYGAQGGSCNLTIEGYFPTDVAYLYQNYNESGMIMNGVKEGEFQLLSWTLTGIIEISGAGDGWIYYFHPFTGSNPLLSARTWRVCNRDTGCTTPVPINNPPTQAELEGTTFFTHFHVI